MVRGYDGIVPRFPSGAGGDAAVSPRTGFHAARATTTRGMVVLERVYRDVGQLQAIADDLLRLLFVRQA